MIVFKHWCKDCFTKGSQVLKTCKPLVTYLSHNKESSPISFQMNEDSFLSFADVQELIQ